MSKCSYAYDLNNVMKKSTIKQDGSIKILTQNLRCADDPGGNSISERFVRFRRLVMEYKPDLIGTQETTADWNLYLESISSYVAAQTDIGEYGMIGCSREGADATGGEWNTILYRKGRFELLDSDTTWLSYTPNTASAIEGSRCKRICTWALLGDRQTGKRLLFANTHLDHGGNDVREKQMTILMDYLADRIDQYPFYLTGDFNCDPGSPPYAAATERLLDARRTARIDLSTEKRTFHAYKETGGGEIDFIFHNNKTIPLKYEVISKDYDGFVSDHYGVIAEFING